MSAPRRSLSPTQVLAGSATFGALASLITLLAPPALQPPFPILFYLKFDIAEVVDLSAFMLFGPVAGLVTAIIHAGILATAPGGTGPFGASLKFLAVLSTYAGLIIAARFGRQTLIKTGVTMTLFSLFTRVALMTVVNYFYVVFLAQTVFGVDYTGFAQFVLSQSGINVSGAGFIAYVLGLTAIYNAIHVVFSVVVSLLVVNALLNRAPNLLQSRAWITNLLGSTTKHSSSPSD